MTQPDTPVRFIPSMVQRKGNPLLPGGFLVTGLVYDVTTGRIEIVVPPALLRPESPA